MNTSKAEQLTFGAYGHTLHHQQVISPDGQWIVYDTRNEDSAIGTTSRIERVHIESKAVEVLYETSNASAYGPGVGAVTYSPNEDKVLFIHGLNNASEQFPYAMDRRSGVGIDCCFPQQPIHFDARQVEKPFIKGALRGGTHSHSWHRNGQLISFTYNDEVLSQQGITNERTVGVMFPKAVKVELENDSNFSGQYFSVLLTDIVRQAEFGSDQIEKAFDECWIGETNQIAFQGWVREEDGQQKTEIFIATIDFNRLTDCELGNESTYPCVSNAVELKRVTRTPKGVSTFRYWLRSSVDGKFIYFLMDDAFGVCNIHQLSVENGEIKPITTHDTSIYSPFNVSKDGQQFVYFCGNNLVYFNLLNNQYINMIADNVDLYGIPNFDKNEENILFNSYVADDSTSKFLQIFKISVPK